MTSLVKRNGTLGLFPELPSMFDDPFLRNWFNWSNTNQDTGTLPAVNIRETNETYDITVAAPGMTKNDFKVELDPTNNRLTISGEKKEQVEDKHSGFLRKEFQYNTFLRSFTLGDKLVEGDKIQAKYTDGILHIVLPKSPDAKTKATRVIPIG